MRPEILAYLKRKGLTEEDMPPIRHDESDSGLSDAISLGLSGLGDAISRGYGRADTNFLGNAQNIIQKRRENVVNKDVADFLEGRKLLEAQRADQKYQLDQEKEASLRDPNSALSVGYRRAAEMYDPEGAKRGVYANKSAADISPLLGNLKDIAEIGAKKEQAVAVNDIRRSAMEAAQIERDKKEQREMDELAVPGYELTGAVRPKDTEAKSLREAVGQIKDFEEAVGVYSGLIGKYGNTELMGPESGQMDAMAANLKLTLKELQRLGVLSSSDIAFLDAQIPSAGLKSLGTRKETAQAQLETIKGRMRSIFDERIKAAGYKPSGAGTNSQNERLSGSSGLAKEDREAMEWLSANPNDPMADSVRKKLRSKGVPGL